MSLDFLGRMIRDLQAEQRTLRSELRAINDRLAVLGDRVGATEARIEGRFNEMQSELAATLASMLNEIVRSPQADLPKS